mmetsp:Transcript_13827/g.45462  ORF Transcript_13827/g.45462 Transcript_13827/m.45462 type:complete len:220 (-) Transcript_13827:1577-2236(-)
MNPINLTFTHAAVKYTSTHTINSCLLDYSRTNPQEQIPAFSLQRRRNKIYMRLRALIAGVMSPRDGRGGLRWRFGGTIASGNSGGKGAPLPPPATEASLLDCSAWFFVVGSPYSLSSPLPSSTSSSIGGALGGLGLGGGGSGSCGRRRLSFGETLGRGPTRPPAGDARVRDAGTGASCTPTAAARGMVIIVVPGGGGATDMPPMGGSKTRRPSRSACLS